MMAYSAEQNGRWFEGWGGRHERAKEAEGTKRKSFLFRGGRIAIFLKDKFGKMATPWSKNHQVDDKIPPYKKKCTAA